MPAFQAQVSEATKETDPKEFEAMKNLLRQVGETAQKQYGAVGARPVSATPDAATELAAGKKYKAGEYERRKQAATEGYDLAKSADTYGTEFGNKVREALYTRKKLQEEIPEAERRMDVDASLKQKELQQTGQQELAKIQWGGYKSAADRIDAMSAAYDKGILDMEMLDMAKAGALDLADIDRYFTLLQTDLNNQLKDIMAEDEFKQKQAIAAIQAKSQNLGKFIEGLFGIGSAIVTEKLIS